MRAAGFSLVGLLMVLGIVMMLHRLYTIPMLQRGNTARQQAQQISGHGQNGMSHMESIKLAPTFKSGSQLDGLVVATIVAGGPMEEHFGLLPGDEITEIAMWGRARDYDDPELFEALVMDAYSRSQVLVVNRPGVGMIKLPDERAKLPPGGIPQTPVQPAAPGGASGGVTGQLPAGLPAAIPTH